MKKEIKMFNNRMENMRADCTVMEIIEATKLDKDQNA